MSRATPAAGMRCGHGRPTRSSLASCRRRGWKEARRRGGPPCGAGPLGEIWGVPVLRALRGPTPAPPPARRPPTHQRAEHRRLLHFDGGPLQGQERGRRWPPDGQGPARVPPPPPGPGGLRYAREFEGEACPVVQVPGGVLSKAVLEELRPFFRPEEQRPVVLRGLRPLPPALEKWTLEYLRREMGGGATYHAFRAPREVDAFTYYFSDPMYVEASAHECRPPTDSLSVTFGDFCRLHEREAKDPASTAERHYLQDVLICWNEQGVPAMPGGVGAGMQRDLQELDRACLEKLNSLGSLGRLAISQLFVSARGALVPVHFDQSQNLHQQLRGRKRWLLFPPHAAASLYPYPQFHPMDLRARVDLEHPDFERFPRLREALGTGVVADVGPGDVLYIPMHWWHHVHSVDETNISVNFWFLDQGPQGQSGEADAEAVLRPLSPAAELELARQVEAFLVERCGAEGVEGLLRWLAAGRPAACAGGGWAASARYAARRCLQLLGEHGARWLLEQCLDPARWDGLPRKRI